jgi:hypothetical protein
VTMEAAILMAVDASRRSVCHGKLYGVNGGVGRGQTFLGQCVRAHRQGLDARDPALVVNQRMLAPKLEF